MTPQDQTVWAMRVQEMDHPRGERTLQKGQTAFFITKYAVQNLHFKK